MNATPALALRGVSKAFAGQWALRDVDLTLEPGEVHALLGQNGSGKSTLIKILAGYHQPDGGAEAEVDGQPLHLGSAHDAHERGLRFIHQDRALVLDLSVTDNLALGESYERRWWLSARDEQRAAAAALEEFHVDVDPGAPLRALDPAQQTMVAMVRALKSRSEMSGLLVLDEPTASLTQQETAVLFSVVRRVCHLGGTVLFVTHRLPEVFEIADRVTVLRDGQRIGTKAVSELDHDGLIEMIIGRPLEELAPHTPPVDSAEREVLRLDHLAGGDVRDATISVSPGEIVGVTGLIGSGMDSLLPVAFGAQPRTSGEVLMNGEPVPASPRQAVRAGMAFAPSDRQHLGGMMKWTLRENVTLPRLRPRGLMRWMSKRAEVADAQPWLDRLDVTPASSEALLSSLSGGNQQKTVLARWLRAGAQVFLLQEPTAGVDVGSKRAIYESLADVAAAGSAVLLSSSDLEEVCAVCDRVHVMRDGEITATFSRTSLTPDTLMAESMRAAKGSAKERTAS